MDYFKAGGPWLRSNVKRSSGEQLSPVSGFQNGAKHNRFPPEKDFWRFEIFVTSFGSLQRWVC
jgi:hypothetical protein